MELSGITAITAAKPVRRCALECGERVGGEGRRGWDGQTRRAVGGGGEMIAV